MRGHLERIGTFLKGISQERATFGRKPELRSSLGVDLFHTQNNNIKYVKTHEESS